MTQATAYSPVKTALVSLLTSRPGLDGVVVGYAAPEKLPDLRGSGSWENIHFDDATGSLDVTQFCDGTIDFDEDYVQVCRLQVLLTGSLGTQEAADTRLGELVYELLAELSRQDSWDLAALGLDFLETLTILPVSQEWETGTLAPEGHAAKVAFGLRVEARRSFP